MTYVDAVWNRDRNTIDVVERVRGRRVFNTYPTRFVAAWPSSKGQGTSIFGERLEVFETSKNEEFQRELRMMRGQKLYESDINPIFRCLYDHYRTAPIPDLNVAFWDIETDFDPVRGFSSTEEAFSPITAISVYCNWLDTNFTLALKPKGYTVAQAQQICAKFDNTVLCNNEAELLDVFLTLIEDADILTGWNCLDLNSYVFGQDRIIKLGNISPSQSLSNLATVTNTHRSGKKKLNILKTVHGHELRVSDEHRIPVCFKKPSEYKRPHTLLKTQKDYDVRTIKSMLKENDVYVEMCLHKNDNRDLSLKELLIDHWDQFLETGVDLEIDCKTLRKSLQKLLGYKSVNYMLTWKKAEDHVDRQVLMDYLNSKSQHRFLFNKKTNAFAVDIDQPIRREHLQILGMIYTDGFYSNYDSCFILCNKDAGIHSYYESLLATADIHAKWRKKEQDQCWYLAFRGQSIISLLAPMIYKFQEKYVKSLDVEMLSRLSTSQWAAFVSGMIDGDGSVDPGAVSICNYNNDLTAMQHLFFWNNVFVSQSQTYVRIACTDLNQPFVEQLTVGHSVKKVTLENLEFRPIKSSPNMKLNKFFFDDKVLVKIHSIDETDEYIPMGDIETTNHYFVCSAMRVHNSSSYDIPYMHNRIVQVLGKEHTRRMCLWNRFPRKREYEQYGKTQTTYDIFGRVHLDYLDLYRKHTYHEMHSYRLDFVGEYEVGDKKVAYEGSLDKLYNEDFEKFIAYSRQDVMLLVKIDQKLKFIDLSNALAHENGVLLPTTLGSVQLIDNAITNEAHDLGLMVPTRTRSSAAERAAAEDGESQGIAGAFVADPIKGIHQWIGAVDINSLYPSAIRSLNMSKETVVGQIRPDQTDRLLHRRMKEDRMSFADAWGNMFGTLEFNQVLNRELIMLVVDFEDGSSVEFTADELYQWIFENPKKPMILTANGTIIDASKPGVVPGLLARWYSERKIMQAKVKKMSQLKTGIEIPEDLLAEVQRLLAE
jgi:hypothetical protein